jgi:hypothetical protein
MATTTNQLQERTAATLDPAVWIHRRRLGTGISTIVAGLAVAAAFSMPHGELDDATAFLAYARTSYATAVTLSVVSMVAAFAFLPAMAGIGRHLRAQGSRVGAIGALLMVAGFAAMQGFEAVGAGLVEIAALPGTSGEQLRAVIDAATGSIVYDAQFTLFLVGHVIGTVLLGIGVLRTRYLPAALALLLPLSAIGHFIAEAIGNNPLDILSFWALAIGLVTLGVRTLRTPDTHWQTA